MATPTAEDRETARDTQCVIRCGEGKRLRDQHCTCTEVAAVTQALADKGERVLEEAAKAIDAKHESVTMSEQNGLDIATAVVRSLKSGEKPTPWKPKRPE